MAKDLFFLPTYKNVSTLFEKIENAKAPEAFTTRYLSETLGLKGSGDRALINMLKKLGMLDQSGRPTDRYYLLKNRQTAGPAIAAGLKEAYKPLFDANEALHTLNNEQLKGLVSQVTGTDAKGAANVAYTFNAIAKSADFSHKPMQQPDEETDAEQNDFADEPKTRIAKTLERSPLRADFHFNIQVHLPANGTEETYLNIFNALRRTFS